MKISIITPSFNQGMFLEETILSIISQKYPNIEYILIDGGSTDNSIDIIKKYAFAFDYWVSEKDKGQSDAINKGLRRATGEIVTWINSDDLLLPGSLQRVAEIFGSLPKEIGLIHGGTILFDHKKDLSTVFSYSEPNLERYLSGMAFPQPSAFFRKSYLEKVGLLDENLHYGMDYHLFNRLACVCRFEPVKEIFSKYRLHSESKSVAQSDRFIEDWKKVFISFCKSIQWPEGLHYLEQTGLYDNVLTYEKIYNFCVDSAFIAPANLKKVLFYHLSDVLKELYWSNQRGTAKELLKMLKRDFEPAWFGEEERLRLVLRKLAIPDPILNLLKTSKKLLKFN